MPTEQLPIDRKADVIRTFTGIYVNVFAPTPDMFNIEDIAHGLANTCRWAGQTFKFYSVAQHSVYCSSMPTDNKTKLAALMHDASEAYLTDIPSPIKRKLYDYQRIEQKLLRCILDKFGIEYPFADYVKFTDRAILEFEWDKIVLKKSWTEFWTPEKAEQKFLQIFKDLT